MRSDGGKSYNDTMDFISVRTATCGFFELYQVLTRIKTMKLSYHDTFDKNSSRSGEEQGDEEGHSTILVETRQRVHESVEGLNRQRMVRHLQLPYRPIYLPLVSIFDSQSFLHFMLVKPSDHVSAYILAQRGIQYQCVKYTSTSATSASTTAPNSSPAISHHPSPSPTSAPTSPPHDCWKSTPP